MDWGMMKNIDPAVAATVICIPAPNVSNGTYSAIPRGEHSMEHRSALGRNVSGSISPTATLTCWHRVLRNRLRFGVAISLVILATDVILRFSWLLRFYHGLFPSADIFVLCTQFLEVFRRALWNLLRVEWENLKQSGHHHHAPHPVKPPSSIQLMLVSEDEKTSFLTSRANASHSKLTNGSKITVEKNAEA
jgi:EXS family